MERIRCGMCIDSKKIWHRLVCDKYDCKRVCLWQFWRKFDRSNTFRPIDDTIRTVDDEFRSIDKIRCIVNLIWARAESRMAKNWPEKVIRTSSSLLIWVSSHRARRRATESRQQRQPPWSDTSRQSSHGSSWSKTSKSTKTTSASIWIKRLRNTVVARLLSTKASVDSYWATAIISRV